MRNARKENKRHRWTFPGHTDCPGRSRRQGESCLWNRVASQLRSQSQPRWVGREPRAGKRALSRPPNFCRHLLPICQSRESAQSFTMSVFLGKINQILVSWLFSIRLVINIFLDIWAKYLDAIASPGSYPCQSISEWVSDSFRCDAIASPSFASLFVNT